MSITGKARAETASSRGWLSLAIVTISVAAFLRFFHLGSGLPSSPDVDASKFVDAAIRMVKQGDWRPVDFQYPTFFTYVLRVLYGILGTGSDYAAHLIARGVSAGFGVGLAILAWALGRRLGGFTAASIAAGLTAVSVVGVTSSRMAATDTMTAFLITAALCFLVGPALSLGDKPTFVIVNSYVGSQFASTPENRRWFPISVDRYARTMERIERQSDRVFEIRGWEERRPGPDIIVYRLRPA